MDLLVANHLHGRILGNGCAVVRCNSAVEKHHVIQVWLNGLRTVGNGGAGGVRRWGRRRRRGGRERLLCQGTGCQKPDCEGQLDKNAPWVGHISIPSDGTPESADSRM